MADDRAATLARIWQGARNSLLNERENNKQRQESKKLGGALSVGDSAIILIPGMKRTFQLRWDARWEIMRARHLVYWIRPLPTRLEKVLNREKLRWVPSDVDWSFTSMPVNQNQSVDLTTSAPPQEFSETLDASADLPGAEPSLSRDRLEGDTDQSHTNLQPAQPGSVSKRGDVLIVADNSSGRGQCMNTDHRYPTQKRQAAQQLEWENQCKRERIALLHFAQSSFQ